MNLLVFSIIVFMISLGTVGAAQYRLRTLETTPTPTVLPEPVGDRNVLSPEVVIDPALIADEAELTRTLLAPLRNYYATRPERLKSIQINQAPEDHTTQVRLLLQVDTTEQGTEFYFDRTGEDRTGPYPTWEPALLDNT